MCVCVWMWDREKRVCMFEKWVWMCKSECVIVIGVRVKCVYDCEKCVLSVMFVWKVCACEREKKEAVCMRVCLWVCGCNGVVVICMRVYVNVCVRERVGGWKVCVCELVGEKVMCLCEGGSEWVKSVHVCVGMCKWVESIFACVWVCVRECMFVSKMCVYVHVRERKWVCVWEREREREKNFLSEWPCEKCVSM